MAIPQNIIEEVQDKTDIVELVSSYVPLKKRGRNFICLCPFHNEKTPSFSVSPDRGIFHCFGCGIGGGAIRFVMEYEKVPFPEAVEMLARRIGVQIPKKASPYESQKSKGYSINKEACLYYHKNLFTRAGQKYLEYLQRRGINKDTIKKFKLGLALPGYTNLLDYMRPKGVSISLLEKYGLAVATRKGNYIDFFRDRVIFPIFDVKSRVLAFGARTIADKGIGPKYINTQQTPLYHKGKSLYGIHLSRDSIRDKDCCLVVEGYTDTIVPFGEGVTNIVASLGTALTQEQIRLIKRYTNKVVLVYDSDIAGKTSSLRAIDLMIEEGLNVNAVTLPKAQDPDTFILKEGKEEFLRLVNSSQDFFFYKLDRLKENLDENKLREKSEILKEMLFTLNRFNDHIVKYEYLKKLAEHLDTDESSLRLELSKIEKGKAYELADTDIREKKENIFSEEYLVKSMLVDKKVLSLIKENIEIEEFSDVVLKDIVKTCYKVAESGSSFKLRNIITCLSDEAQNKVSQLLAEDFSPEEEVLKESVAEFKKRIQRKKRKDLKEKIRQAEKVNDQDSVISLISEYQRLIQEEKKN